MKKIIILILLLCPYLTDAQVRHNSLKFIYINHSSDTPVSELTEYLKRNYKDAKNHDWPLIIYLSNMGRPFIAVAGISSVDYDDEFSELIGELQEKRYHEVDPKSDVEHIVELFNEYDFINDYGSPKFDSMTWSFYVNNEYWKLGYNELVIAQLYYVLNIASLPQDFLNLQICYSGEDELEYDEECPFGTKNLCPSLSAFELIKF